MKKTLNIYTVLGFLIILGMGSCKKDPVIGGTATQAMAGEWWVHFASGDADYPSTQWFNLSTYNTAANNPAEMWFDDLNNTKSFWDVKGKVSCNVSNLTFSGTAVANQYYTSTFTVANGKILTKAATAPYSKDKVDSISFSVTFSDETPTVTHLVSGYKRTGFTQDDH